MWRPLNPSTSLKPVMAGTKPILWVPHEPLVEHCSSTGASSSTLPGVTQMLKEEARGSDVLQQPEQGSSWHQLCSMPRQCSLANGSWDAGQPIALTTPYEERIVIAFIPRIRN